MGVSPGYPAFGTVTVNLGSVYAGQSVRLRYRIGADAAVGAPGWEVDDIAIGGITNLPFHALVPDRGLCVDSDADGVPDLSDCAPLDGTTWSVPSEARNLNLEGSPTTTLTWSPPAAPGGSSTLYDVLRSGSASSFISAACLESGVGGQTAADPVSPATIFFYLVRSRNACGGNLGSDSGGNPRSGVTCP